MLDGNGRNQNHTADGQRAWLTYAERRTSTADGCPAGWERIPALSFSITWRVNSTTNSWLLSSDIATGSAAGTTIHGDFINGWNPAHAEAWYDSCLRTSRSCTDVIEPVDSAACRQSVYSSACNWRRLIGGTDVLFGN